MDPLSFTASLLTLLSTAAGVTRTTLQIHHDISAAPQEIRWISSQILQAQSRLNFLAKIYEKQCILRSVQEGESLLSAEDLEPLKLALEKAEGILGEIQGFVRSMGGKSGRTGGLKWVLRDKMVVMRLVGCLRDVESGLSTILVAMTL
jgi:hypothetical protein